MGDCVIILKWLLKKRKLNFVWFFFRFKAEFLDSRLSQRLSVQRNPPPPPTPTWQQQDTHHTHRHVPAIRVFSILNAADGGGGAGVINTGVCLGKDYFRPTNFRDPETWGVVKF